MNNRLLTIAVSNFGMERYCVEAVQTIGIEGWGVGRSVGLR